jgi:phage tail sheath gpL-like
MLTSSAYGGLLVLLLVYLPPTHQLGSAGSVAHRRHRQSVAHRPNAQFIVATVDPQEAGAASVLSAPCSESAARSGLQ